MALSILTMELEQERLLRKEAEAKLDYLSSMTENRRKRGVRFSGLNVDSSDDHASSSASDDASQQLIEEDDDESTSTVPMCVFRSLENHAKAIQRKNESLYEDITGLESALERETKSRLAAEQCSSETKYIDRDILVPVYPTCIVCYEKLKFDSPSRLRCCGAVVCIACVAGLESEGTVCPECFSEISPLENENEEVNDDDDDDHATITPHHITEDKQEEGLSSEDEDEDPRFSHKAQSVVVFTRI
eukprot:CAMPEP_0197296956 /NCGR_PEP_ID=MMETSP0890-20130614/39816_1 /TAXON_ID=44058 ORGANISM="Aureoumbra lagunensis, Strain CCMP1510" /NCGR_SAMPLE_ID=MMETSP0890 /ASSEMBLY_ACC=CAM_ASM_000533 /LENGTH=245 /DNA_ID=CAMNT_0042773819 /DNA_START=244 /DNA_END=981 /DNA_ORIENTATION=+